MSDKDSAPDGLKTPGKALWTDVVTEYELRIDEKQLLEQACLTADELAGLQVALSEAELVTTSKSGAVKVNPLLVQARQHRLALATLLARLQLDSDDEDEQRRPVRGGMATSAKARRAALTRWHSDSVGA